MSKVWEMDILLHTQLRDLSWNIATRFEHPTKKNVENLEMVQKKIKHLKYRQTQFTRKVGNN